MQTVLDKEELISTITEALHQYDEEKENRETAATSYWRIAECVAVISVSILALHLINAFVPVEYNGATIPAGAFLRLFGQYLLEQLRNLFLPGFYPEESYSSDLFANMVAFIGAASFAGVWFVYRIRSALKHTKSEAKSNISIILAAGGVMLMLFLGR